MKKKSANIRWSFVDLTRPAKELAEELGVHVNAIYSARRRLGIQAPNLAGGTRPGAGGARYGNQNRKGTGHNMANLNIRLPEELLAEVRKHAENRKLTVSEFARQAFIKFIHQQGTDNGTTKET